MRLSEHPPEGGAPAGGAGSAELVRRLTCDVSEPAAGYRGARVYRVVLIRAGEWQGKGLIAGRAALAAAAAKFEGVASFLNPPARQPGQHGHPPLERLLGVIENAAWDDAANGITADYRLASTEAARGFARLMDDWLAARAAGRRVPEVGLSAVLTVTAGPPREDGLREVLEVVRVEQVDAVHKPAAGGEFLRVVNDVAEDFGDLQDGAERNQVSSDDPAAGYQVSSRNQVSSDDPAARNQVTRRNLVSLDDPAERNQVSRRNLVSLDDPATGYQVSRRNLVSSDQNSVQTMVDTLRESLLETRLAASGLPAGWQRVVRGGLPAGWQVADLDAEIGRVRAAWAEDQSRHTVQGVRAADAVALDGSRGGGATAITHLLDSRDQLEEALAALIEGRSPRHGIRPLAGIREAYLLLSGDYEMTGVFRRERVTLANVTSTTMAGLLASALNKVVASEFASYPRWWEPVARREAFGNLQTVKWVKLGGVGELPTVAEGAAYTELTWGDATESVAWQKRGGYLGLTLEAMDKDDVGLLRKAPLALAQAAWLTLGKAVASVFTQSDGAGPAMSDGKALFHADHGNLGSDALSAASWNAARLAMRKQTELGSGERLGALTSPRFLLVPPDLEATALMAVASEGLPVLADGSVSVEGADYEARLNAARRRVIVVDLWTDANNWAAVADPRLCPAIGLGFRYGETPEIFSVASPTSGLMFTNDVMPVKVRWFFAAGAMDWRGVYKANVA